MTRNPRTMLVLGAVAGFAILASLYFLTKPTRQTMEAEVAALLDERRQWDETVWAQEVAASNPSGYAICNFIPRRRAT